MSNERNERGRFVERVSSGDVRNVVAAHDEPVTAKEVGEDLSITNRAALNKLNELHERGDVERKKVGGRSVVWWLSDEQGSRGGSADPLRGLVGLVDDDGAERVKAGSREFREALNDRMDSRRTDRTTENSGMSGEGTV